MVASHFELFNPGLRQLKIRFSTL